MTGRSQASQATGVISQSVISLFALLCFICPAAFLRTDPLNPLTASGPQEPMERVYCRKTDQQCLASCQQTGVGLDTIAGIESRCDFAHDNRLKGQLMCQPDRYLPPLRNVSIAELTDTSVKLKWVYSWRQFGYPEDGQIRYNCSLDRRQELTQLQGLASRHRKAWRSGWSIPERLCVRLLDLQPLRAYTCLVWAQLGAKRSRPVVRRFVTKFGKPQLTVAQLKVHLDQSGTSRHGVLSLQWDAGMQNNLALAYRITIERPFNATIVTRKTSISLVIDRHRLVPHMGAYPEAGFLKLSVLAFNQMGDGPAVLVEAAVPPYQNDASFVNLESGCQMGRPIYWFDANSSASVSWRDSQLCLREQMYRQCQAT